MMALCLIASIFVVASFTSVHAQGGSIVISSDPGLTDCTIVDAGSLIIVYIGHLYSQDVTGARFKFDIGGLPWVHLQTNSPYWTMGDPLNGITVCYGSCLSSPDVILEMLFFGSFAPTCSYVGIAGHPVDGDIWALDCESNMVYASGGQAIVNPDGSCFCHADPGKAKVKHETKRSAANFCSAVPVEQSTWGMIKALYR
jgi:hypothetical protein